MNSSGVKILSYSTLDMGAKITKHKSGASSLTQRNLNAFSGEMQQLILNGKSYFELIANEDLLNSVNRTVDFNTLELPHKQPINFQSTSSWIELPKIDTQNTLLIQFHFKTAHENGLIMYNRGLNNDFLVVEIFNGQVNFAFSASGEMNRIKSKSRTKLNDNKWHLLSIWRSTKTTYELSVDSLVYKHSIINSYHNTHDQHYGSAYLNLIDRLYVGGLRNQSAYVDLVIKNRILSRHGFKGCLASMEINGLKPDLEHSLKNRDKHSIGSIIKGCDNGQGECSANNCKNGGICAEKWNENKVKCDCEMTTFSGKFCEKSEIVFLAYISRFHIFVKFFKY
jgi:neurexin